MKKYIAEFIGTAVLVTLGCGTAMLVGCDAANGFRVIIMTEANSQGNKRVFRLLPKLKTEKLSGWCAV